MKKLFILILLCFTVSVQAATNYVLYSVSSGIIEDIGSTYIYDSVKGTITVNETLTGLLAGWADLELDSTTDKIPTVFTNIIQVVHTKVLPMTKDQSATATANIQITPAVQALMDAVNKRLSITNQITAKELLILTTNKIQAASSIQID